MPTLKSRIPDGMQLTYTNFAVTQTFGEDVAISFFQGTQPIANTPEELAAIESGDYELDLVCVARLVMSRRNAGLLWRSLRNAVPEAEEEESATEPGAETKES
jgi:hypothetical protein